MCFHERKIAHLLRAVDRAWKELTAHRHPRHSLSEAEEEAWTLEHEALSLRFQAACRRYKAECEHADLARIEREALAHSLEEHCVKG